jgi:hypothetical protein
MYYTARFVKLSALFDSTNVKNQGDDKIPLSFLLRLLPKLLNINAVRQLSDISY